MTPDNDRQQAWREAVRAFRLAASALKVPALLTDLSVDESLQDLTQEPPLVSFSPFDALPDGVLTGLGEQAYASGSSGSGQTLDSTTSPRIWPRTSSPVPGSNVSGRDPDPATGRGSASLEGGRSCEPSDLLHSPQDLPAAALSRYDEPAVRSPVFSFRRSGPMAQRQPSQRNQYIPGDSTKEAESKPYTGRFHVPEPTPEDRQQGAPVPVNARGDMSGAARTGAASDDQDAGLDCGTGTHMPDERVLYHPMTLVNDLADEALEVVRSRTPDVDVRPSNTSPSQPDPPGERMIHSPEPSYEAHGRDAGSERGARDYTSGVRSLPHSVTSSGLADGLLETAGDRSSGLFVPGSNGSPPEDVDRARRGDDLPESDGEAYDSSAIALIESLTEHLLPSQFRTVADLSRLDENMPGVGASTVSGVVDNLEEATASVYPPFASLESVHEEITSGATLDPAPTDTYKGMSGVASGRCMDAETFASLVNDVLVEQARRHGVDLS